MQVILIQSSFASTRKGMFPSLRVTELGVFASFIIIPCIYLIIIIYLLFIIIILLYIYFFLLLEVPKLFNTNHQTLLPETKSSVLFIYITI